jgi:hypothetical protein
MVFAGRFTVRYVRCVCCALVRLALAGVACGPTLLPVRTDQEPVDALRVSLAFEGEPALNREVTLRALSTAGGGEKQKGERLLVNSAA